MNALQYYTDLSSKAHPLAAEDVAHLLAQIPSASSKSVKHSIAERLMIAHLPIAIKTAQRFARCNASLLDDLISVGVNALFEIALRGSVPSGYSFAVYAQLRLRGAILDYLRSTAPLIHVPRQKIRKAKEDPCAISSQSVLNAIMGALSIRVSGCSSCAPEFGVISGEELADRSESLGYVDGRSDLARALARVDIEEALAVLSSQERNVLENYYALKGERAKTHDEIGGMLSLSGERISQIRLSALEKMRMALVAA